MNQSIETDDIGVVYLAFGYEYCIQAVRSVCSLKTIHPNLNVSIVTNVPLNSTIHGAINYNGTEVGPELFDEVVYIDDETDTNRQYKTSINNHTPYSKTLFLDCDTVVKREIVQGFQFLNYADLAAVPRPIPSRAMSERWDGDIHVDGIDIEDTTTFYSGVFFFNTGATSDFFASWNSRFNDFGYEYDQYSFTNAIIETDIDYLPTPIIWNTMDTDIQRYKEFDEGYEFAQNIRIHHQNYLTASRMMKLRKIENEVGDRLLNVEDQRAEKIRTDFRNDYSNLNIAKKKMSQYKGVSLMYKKLNGLVPIPDS